MITPIIQTLQPKKLIGQRLVMRFSDDKTSQLWQNFIPRRREIKNAVNTSVISLQHYPKSFDFNPTTEFEKWAAVEVFDFNTIPEYMETLVVDGGLYAVFHYKGSSTDTSIFEYIFSKWLPSSAYTLDDRPHFEILGEKYKNNDPNSEEDIYIPIKAKG